MHSHFGAAAALGSAGLWAFASTRYTATSRTIGSAAVNLTRTLIVLPIFLIVALFDTHGALTSGITTVRLAWLAVSVFCSYALADLIFFASARRLGISTALAIASSYPLLSSLWGVMINHEPLGIWRALGIVLSVAGLVALVKLANPSKKSVHDFRGVLLAIATSILWAGNTISVKNGSTGLSPFQANFFRYLIALPILALTVRVVTPQKRPAFRALLFPSIAEAFIGSTLFVFALSNTELAIGSTLSAMAPLLAVPFSLMIGEERFHGARIVAIAVTVCGVILLC